MARPVGPSSSNCPKGRRLKPVTFLTGLNAVEWHVFPPSRTTLIVCVGSVQDPKPNGANHVEKPVTSSPQAESDTLHDGSSSVQHSETDGTGTDDEDDVEDDEEEEEPSLKYELLHGSVAELFVKDSASTLAVLRQTIAVGTHNGVVHLLNFTGERVKSYRSHSATINHICIDTTGDFVATASVDGQVVIVSLSTPETYSFDFRRPVRTVSLEPNFGKRGSRAFACGGMAGTMIMQEKGWLGHKEVVLGSDEGPIWASSWRSTFIAWANDMGVKLYDTASQSRITHIDRPKDSPRADLFKCNLYWQDDTTLLIAWADHIKIARVRSRPRGPNNPAAVGSLASLSVDITVIFQVECMLSGIAPYIPPNPASPTAPTSFLALAYIPPDTFSNEATSDRTEQARKAANRPELRIISRSGEELSSDVLSLPSYHLFSCNDYTLVEADPTSGEDRCYVVLSPKNIVLVRPRDRKDHVQWLVEKKRYEEALDEVEAMGGDGAAEIGEQYVAHLVDEGEFEKAARLCPKVHSQNSKRWEDWIYVFAQKKQLHTIIPYVPTEKPLLSRQVYGIVLGHFLAFDRPALLRTIRTWPPTIYDIPAVIVSVKSELERSPLNAGDSTILRDCLAELYMFNRQPGKALEYYLRLRRPGVFDLIREHNLFDAVQDQALPLVEFDQELVAKRKVEGVVADEKDHGVAITLLVDHAFSIPVPRVVQQLQVRPQYLYFYLDALFDKDPHLASDYADLQVQLYAEYAPHRLIDFLRASNYYSLEKAYNACKDRDFVPEMVFLLGRMGNNKQALTLIIERLGDVHRAIDFAKEQNDDDLWEDLLRYSETRPTFIRGLLENVGSEINPIRLIRRITNGLEIPGLKEALIKILHDFNLQISLLEGCEKILFSDCTHLAGALQKTQTAGFFTTTATRCQVCSLPLYQSAQSLSIMFLCHHVAHASCVSVTGGLDALPKQPDMALASLSGSLERGLAAKIAFAATLRAKMDKGCPVCHKLNEGAAAR